jgi:predicted  nucleic acid-binding Zn-ribbon protein
VTVRARPEDQLRLLDLQAFDTRAGQLAHARRTLPQLAALTASVAEADALRRRVAEARGVLDDARTELKRVESDVQVVDARIARDTTRMQSVTNSKDAQGLEHELASLAVRKGDLEDIQLAVMERVEAGQAEADAVEAEQRALTERVASVEAERDAAFAKMDAELAELAVSRETLVAELPSDLVELYERQRSRYGIGAALLRRGVSEGSNVALTGSDLAAVRAAAPDEVVLDPESGCILVRTDESGLESRARPTDAL